MAITNEKVMLIVCEGTNTEPAYFERIERAVNIALKNRISKEEEVFCPKYIHLTVLKNKDHVFTKLEIEKLEKEDVKPVPKGQKYKNANARSLSHDALKEILEDLYGEDAAKEIYEEVKAMPLRFVAFAAAKNEQSGGLFDEIWAVYDKNGHTEHKEARKKAEGDGIKIAFSSRSFEYWLLLHFERINQAFSQTECKEGKGKKKKSVNCGSKENTNFNDCKGSRCIAGYLRNKGYLPIYEKSSTPEALTEMMSILLSEKHLKNAMENAAWLRYHQEKLNQEIYNINPWSNIDKLVKSILGIQIVYIWTELGADPINMDGMPNLVVERQNNNILVVTADSINVNPYNCSMYLKDKDRNIYECLDLNNPKNRGFSQIRKQKQFFVQSSQPLTELDFCFEIGNQILLIEL